MEIKCCKCNHKEGVHTIGQNFYCQECFDEYNQSYSEAFPDDPESAECVHCKNTFTRNCLMNIDGDWYCLNCGSQHPEVLLDKDNTDNSTHCSECGMKQWKEHMFPDEDEPEKLYCHNCGGPDEPTGYPHL